MAAVFTTSLDDVFINCPFDKDYKSIFEALIFAVFACGFRARSAREMDDGGEARITKLLAIIKDCRYGIHDVSRTELDPHSRLPRFNMPLELGIFLGAKHLGGAKQRQKRLLIFDTEKYRYQQFISDLAGSDIHAHAGRPENAIAEVRDWLRTVSGRPLSGVKKLQDLYVCFLRDLPELAETAHLDPSNIGFTDFENFVVAWLADPPARGAQSACFGRF